MFYVILAANLLVFGLLAAFVVRFIRSSPESRRAFLRPTKKSIVIAASVFGLAIAGIITVLIVTFGVVGFQVSNEAKRHLESRFGEASTWSIQLSNHIEQSESPKLGSYDIGYRYGERAGTMKAFYREIDGKLNIEFREE